MRLMGMKVLVPRPGTSRPRRAIRLSLSVAGGEVERPISGVGHQHHLHSDVPRLSVSGGDHRLVQPGDPGMAVVEHDGHGLLYRGAGGSVARFGKPKIFNSDQGAQFTSAAFTARLEAAGIAITMDGRGSWIDNIFVERLWRP